MPRQQQYSTDTADYELEELPRPPLELRSSGAIFVHELPRLSLVLAFAVILLVIVILGFAKTANWSEAKDFIQLLLPVVTLVLGGAAGFYFGKRQ